MNVFAFFRDAIEEEFRRLVPPGAPAAADPPARFTVEPPRDPAHGELATNAALVLARTAGVKPRRLAEELAGRLAARPEVAAAEAAGPGFVNFRLTPAFWQARLGDVLRAGEGYGDSKMGRGVRVNVEYVSANPTGPLHVGHGRGAVVGDALASLLAKAGFEVAREYYVNDAGVQVDLLARSLRLRYREALGEEVGAIPEGHYPGEYLIEAARTLVARDGDKWRKAAEADWLPALREFAVEAMMASIRADLASLGVRHDVFSSERALTGAGAVERAVEGLAARGLVYVGTLEAPRGKAPEDWEERPQTLFRAARFGDDVDRPLKKSDGSWTYFAADIAYHHDKFRRGFPVLIDVWGADHKGYVKRMAAAVEAATGGAATLDVRVCNLVHLREGGEPVKMSKRAGSFVALRDVVDKVGRDAVRFTMLTRSPEAALEFDLARAIEQSRDNPVFYVQYAHARSRSAMRNAAERFPGLALDDGALAGADASLLDDMGELALIRLLAGWPRVVETAAQAREPHRIAAYLAEVAASFHGQWSRGNRCEGLRFVADDEALTRARMALARAAAIVIASGLKTMGVQPVEEMR